MHRFTMFLGLLVFLGSQIARAEYSREMRIAFHSRAAVNGEVSVSPGEVLDLSADLWATNSGCLYAGCPQSIPAGEVLWFSSDRPGSVCDLYSSSQCHAETQFRVTGNGVMFQVPNYFNVPITITASLRGGEPSARLVLIPRPITYVSSSPQVVIRDRPLVVIRPPVVLPPRIYYPRPPHHVYYPRPTYRPPYHPHHRGGHQRR